MRNTKYQIAMNSKIHKEIKLLAVQNDCTMVNVIASMVDFGLTRCELRGLRGGCQALQHIQELTASYKQELAGA